MFVFSFLEVVSNKLDMGFRQVLGYLGDVKIADLPPGGGLSAK